MQEGQELTQTGCGGGGSTGGGGGDDGGGADYPNYFKIEWVTFDGDYESWDRGDPEFKAKITRLEDSGSEQISHSTIHFANENQIESSDVLFGLPFPVPSPHFFPWRPDKYETYHIQWYEDDGKGGTKEINLSSSFQYTTGDGDKASVGISYKLSFNGWDDILSDMTVNYDDPEPHEYNLGAPDAEIYLTDD